MTLERFGELVASYGADPARWPADESHAGADLIAANTEAAAIVAQAAALDLLLASLPEPEPASAALKDRLEAVSMLPQADNIQKVKPTVRRRPSIFAALFDNAAPRSLIPQVAGLTMICLVGGVALGLSNFAGPAGPTLQVDPTAYFFGDPGLDQDLEELD